MRFVQFADCHVDSVLGSSLALSNDKKAVLREDIRRSVAASCELAIETQADLVLIPGDLFDFESVTNESISFIVDHLAGLAPRPVFISPGNHDSLRAGSPYLPISGISWPGNVHIFTAQTFESVVLSGLGCSVTGIAHVHKGITEHVLVDTVPRKEADVSILLFHGSREGFRPSDKENVMPFSDMDLVRQRFTYAAIGHYHSHSFITDPEGRIIGAYSGCTQGRGLDETDQKVAIVGSIDAAKDIELGTVEVGQRRVVKVDVSVTGIRSTGSISEKVGKTIQLSGARPQDIVVVNLFGSAECDVDAISIESEFSNKYFHVRVSSAQIVADYDAEATLEESAAASLRTAFLRRMLDLKKSAVSRDELAIIDDAIHYGLCALDGRALEPRDVD